MVLYTYYCSVMTFETSDSFVDNPGNRMLEIITRAKSDTVAFMPPHTADSPRKRGCPRKYGERVVLRSLFISESDMFVEVKVQLYGKTDFYTVSNASISSFVSYFIFSTPLSITWIPGETHNEATVDMAKTV